MPEKINSKLSENMKPPQPTFDFQNNLLKSCCVEQKQSVKFIIGIDEAGRGPLAGDVFAAAVWIDENKFPHEIATQINDSKKISEKKREKIFNALMNESGQSIQYGIGRVDAKKIDEINILQATFLAMQNAYLELQLKLKNKNSDAFVLIDGNIVPPFFRTEQTEFSNNVQTVIKGDSICMSIATASIIAKVSRDRYITEIARDYPQYNFEKHKGYGTATHIAAIKKLGFCNIHRQSFIKNILKNG